MTPGYRNIQELKRKKELLKQEVEDLEDIILFKNTKESLSAFTSGKTDYFLRTDYLPDGETQLKLDTGNIIKAISKTVKDKISKKSVLEFAASDKGIAVWDNLAKAGIISTVNKIAKKNLGHKNWENKLIGLALVYIAPIAFEYLQKEFTRYQKKKTSSSMGQLI